MKRLKMTLSLLVVSSLFFTLPTDFAASKSLSLEEAITLSKENSADIRGVLNQDFTTQDTIRKNIQNSYQLGHAMDTYYDYIELYDEVVDANRESTNRHPWRKYIGRSHESLDKSVGSPDPMNPTGLHKKIIDATNAGQTDKVAEYNAEIEFISLYKVFGDNPSLSKESKYDQFKKNEAMLQNSVDLINTQYEQGLIAATRGTEAGIIKLYVGIKDLAQGLDVQKDLLQTYEDGLKNMKDSFDQGLVSKIEYENQQHTVEMKRLETENLQLQYDNLVFQLKKMCEIPMTTTLNLSTNFNNEEFSMNSPSTYYEQAFDSNMDHINLSANLTYEEKNFAVMNKYLQDMDSNKDFTQPIYYQEKIDQQEKIDDLNFEVKNKELLIESNVVYAYNDLRIKKKKVEHNEDAVSLAEVQLNSGIQSYKLGQITQLQLDQLRLQYASALMTADQNIRAYNTGVENFKLLINYGVTY